MFTSSQLILLMVFCTIATVTVSAGDIGGWPESSIRITICNEGDGCKKDPNMHKQVQTWKKCCIDNAVEKDFNEFMEKMKSKSVDECLKIVAPEAENYKKNKPDSSNKIAECILKQAPDIASDAKIKSACF